MMRCGRGGSFKPPPPSWRFSTRGFSCVSSPTTATAAAAAGTTRNSGSRSCGSLVAKHARLRLFRLPRQPLRQQQQQPYTSSFTSFGGVPSSSPPSRRWCMQSAAPPPPRRVVAAATAAFPSSCPLFSNPRHHNDNRHPRRTHHTHANPYRRHDGHCYNTRPQRQRQSYLPVQLRPQRNPLLLQQQQQQQQRRLYHNSSSSLSSSLSPLSSSSSSSSMATTMRTSSLAAVAVLSSRLHPSFQETWRRSFAAAASGGGGDENNKKGEDTNEANETDKNKDENKVDDAPPKIPRGFSAFFPPDARRQPPSGASDSSKVFSKDGSGGTGGGPKKDDDNSKDKQDGKDKERKKDKGDYTQQEESMDNLPGLLALLAAVVTLRSWIENEEAELGQEITFVEFRNRFLATGQVDTLQIVNKKMARVILKDSAPAAAADPTAAAAGTTSWSDDGGSSSSTADPTAGFGTDGSGMLARRTTKRQHPKHYYFYIGSVEGLEEKLATAQQHLHPADWIEVQYVTRTNYALEALKSLPMIAFLAAIYFGSRSAMGASGFGGVGGGAGGGGAGGRGGMGGIFSIGKSTAKKINKEDVTVTFKDVAGCEQAKMEIMEFVDFLKDSDRFTKLGAKIPKGALLCGPPGTGKTLLAKAVAGESGVPFYSISGSDFIEMFVGVGPSRVRDLFKEARANAPCIVFIDEIDAVGRQRGRGGFSGGGNDERENTLNQLLVEMDGFTPTTGIVVLAGTNRIDILDQALTRPGRFDRQIVVDRPDLQGRKEIFMVHLKNITLEGPMEEYAGRLAGLTPGFAGADIANICNEAAIVAARRKGDAVTMADFEKATDRIIGGLESNKIMSSEERSIVAHHEAGHAIAGWFLEHADPLLKVTIIPRTSGALGFAQYLPKEVFLRSEDQIMDIVQMALAGRAAEEVFFGNVTTGASDDLRRVTQLVYGMIKDFGMNSRLGQLSFPSDRQNNPGDKPYSDSTAEAMDEEARKMVDAAYQKTLALIREHRNDVEKLAKLLLEKETITHDDIEDLVGPRPFGGDSVYQEFVSHRARANKDALVAKNKKDKEDAEKSKDDAPFNDGELTPGLA